MRCIDIFTIGRFRGIQDLGLEQLGQINLLVGDNNSGKTSVLEALSLYSDPLNGRKWRDVASSREVSSSSLGRLSVLSQVDRLAWLFHQQGDSSSEPPKTSAILLTGLGFNPLREMSANYTKYLAIEQARYALHKEKEAAVEHIQINVSVISSFPQPALFDMDENREVTLNFSEYSRPPIDLNRNPFMAAQLINPFSHRLSSLQPRLWTRVVEDDLKGSTLELLRSYDPKIQDIDLIFPEERRLVLSVKHQQLGRAPLSTFGDGLRRIFTLATAVPQCRNGLLLIDELETAIHTKALRRTFEWLVNACIQNNVQLFATTHSLETIDAVIDACKSDDVDLVAYRLEQGEPQTRATRFDKGLLTRLREDLGMEVR